MRDARKTKNQINAEHEEKGRALKKAEKDLQNYTTLGECKRSIRACRESEEQYKTIVNHLSEGIVITRNDQILFFNQKCLNYLGYNDLKEIADRSIFSFVHPDDRKRVEKYALNRQKGGYSPSTYEFRCVKPEGTTSHLRASVAPMIFNGEIASLVNLFDITESKKAEEALRATEVRYRSIFENTGTVMLIVEEDMTISLANNKFEELTGYKREEVERKKKWTEFVHQTDMEQMVKQHKLRRSNPTQAIKNYEFRLVCRDGSLRYILLTVDVIPGTKSSVASLLDITDRKHVEQELRKSHTALHSAHQQLIGYDREIRQKYQELANSEQALRQSEAKYRQMFENAMEGIHQTTPEGKYLQVNPAFARMFGYSSPHEMIDSVTDIGQQTYVNLQDREYLIERLQKEDKIEGFEVERLRKDGSKFWILMNIHSVRDDVGNILHFEGTNIDITERKLTEDSLRQSEEKYRILAENASDVIWSLNMDRQFTYISPSVDTRLGWTTEEWKSLRLEDVLTPGSFEQMKKAYEDEIYLEQIPGSEPSRTRTLAIEEYRKDGSIVWAEVTISPLRDAKGGLLGIIGVSRDISERRRAQEALKHSEIRFRTLFEKSPYGISIARDGVTLYTNDACLKMFGYTHLLEFAGTSQLQRVAPESRADIMVRFARRIRGEAVPDTFVLTALRKDGSTFPLFGQTISIQLDDGPAIVSFFEDLTERKQAEEALLEREKRYRQLIDQAADGIFVSTNDGNYHLINKKFCEMLGYTEDELLKLNVLDTYPDELKEIGCQRIKSVRSGESLRFERPMKRKDGTVFQVELSVARLDEQRQQGIIHDITERKQAEDALRQSEEKYRNIFENASEGIFQTAPDGQLLSANPALARMSGYGSAQEMIDSIAELGLHLYVNPDDPKHMVRMLEQWDKLNGFEVEMYRKDGSKFWVSMNIHTVRDAEGNIRYFEGTNVDITARKQAEQELRRNHEELSATYQQLVAYDEEIRQNYEELTKSQQALRQSEEKYRQIFENAIEGIYQTTSEGKFLRVNPAFARMFGYTSPQEIIDSITDIGQQIFVNPSDRRYMVERLRKEGKIEGFEVERYRKDGSKFWISMNIHTVRDGEGNILHYEGTNIDITERKRAEQEHRKLEEQLRQAQKMEAIGTLAGGIAHDFNNILSAVIGYTELAKIEEQREYRDDCLDQVLKASERAKDLVTQILTFSRKREMEKQPVQINPVIKEGIKLLRSSIPSTIEIRHDIEVKPLVVIADQTQIHQVLMNLGTNAAHAMREKGGILDFGLSHERVDKERTLVAHRLGAGLYAKLTVTDTGHGIDPAIIHRIFEPFFSTKPQGEGTGLGMSVVYGIIKSCGGAIDIVSEPGQGTTVSVYLPLAESLKTAENDTTVKALSGHERVLFVDDEAALVDLGERMLRSLGYQVTARTSSIEALELFKARHRAFDLVLTDMTMPNMTGAELAKKMLAIQPDIPIILCTGYSELMTEETAKELGIRRYIMKPLTRKDLGTVIHETLKPA
jgi:PAS domain S-box-containing protein